MVHQTASAVVQPSEASKLQRHVITKPIASTITRTGDQAARPTTGKESKDQTINPSIAPTISYAYQLGYSVNRERLIARLIVQRGDEPPIKEAAKKKPAANQLANQPINQPVDETVDLSIKLASDVRLMANVYSYNQWINQPNNSTINFYNIEQPDIQQLIKQSIKQSIDQPTEVSIDQASDEQSNEPAIEAIANKSTESNKPADDTASAPSTEQSNQPVDPVNQPTEQQSIDQSTEQPNDQPLNHLHPIVHITGVGELLIGQLMLTKDSPLLMEIYLDPINESTNQLVSDFLARCATNRRAINQPVSSSLMSPTKKKSAKAAPVEEAHPNEELPVECHITSRVNAPVTCLIDCTVDEARKEMKAVWEKTEAGRARKARAARERFLEAMKTEQKLEDIDSFKIVKSSNQPFQPMSDAERTALIDQSKELRARDQQYFAIVNQVRTKAIQCAEQLLTETIDKHNVEMKTLQAADKVELQERESIRQMQLREAAQMKAVTDLLALRVTETAAAKLKAAAPVVVDKKAKVEKKKPGAVEEPELMTRAQFLVKVDAVLEPLVAVQSSRQWRVKPTIDQARQLQRDEVKEETDAALERLNETHTKAAEWLSQQEAMRAAAATPVPPMSPTTSRKDNKAKAPSKANDAKAEKERLERERKQAEEWMLKERAEQEDKSNAWSALDVAIQMASSLRELHGQHPENELVIEQATNARNSSIFNELKSVLGKIKRDQRDEAEKEAAIQASLTPRPASPSVKGGAKNTLPASPNLTAIAPDTSRPTTPRIDLTSFIQTNYPAPTPLQMHAVFLNTVKGLAQNIKQLSLDVVAETASANNDRLEDSTETRSEEPAAPESVEPAAAPEQQMPNIEEPMSHLSLDSTTVLQITAPEQQQQSSSDEPLTGEPMEQLTELLSRSSSVLDTLQSKWETEVRTRARKDDKKPKPKGK